MQYNLEKKINVFKLGKKEARKHLFSAEWSGFFFSFFFLLLAIANIAK